ncbi:MAG: His/Gly/Thr/Pro-type tRNA ligase C-terminal domain-containing protein [Firmicutes bacterium]|nr:His/Gly/Thr/Pro-type tRNA ligase C-terminal domain-containing protein [Bacillota bacterium]
MTVLRIIDRREKMSDEKFLDTLHGAEITVSQIDFINKLLGGRDYTRSPWLTRVFESLKIYEGVLDYIQFDPLIVRGFDYYTRTVFEAWDKTGQLKRAIFGGGRFDNLTAQVGGARVPGVGMAPGDMPIRVLLEQFNKMPALSPQAAQVLVTVFAPEFYPDSLKTATNLRNHGIPAELWVEPGAKLDKQLKYADQQKIPFAVIIGPDESAKNTVTLKNLSAKSQETLPIEEAINKMKSGS